MPVGWNWMNSMSCSGRPAPSAIAAPSPGQGGGPGGDGGRRLQRGAVAGAGLGAGAGMLDGSIAAGGENGGLRAKAVQRAVVELQRDQAEASALIVHDQVDGEELDVEFGGVTQSLAVHGVQHGVAGAIGGT